MPGDLNSKPDLLQSFFRNKAASPIKAGSQTCGLLSIFIGERRIRSQKETSNELRVFDGRLVVQEAVRSVLEVPPETRRMLSMDLRTQIAEGTQDLCRRFGIKRLSLFGSVARGDDSGTSDIDFLAEFEAPSPETMPERYFGFIAEAAERFGRPVQLLTPRMVRNPFLKRSSERDRVIVHE